MLARILRKFLKNFYITIFYSCHLWHWIGIFCRFNCLRDHLMHPPVFQYYKHFLLSHLEHFLLFSSGQEMLPTTPTHLMTFWVLVLSSKLLNDRSESSFFVAQGLSLGIVNFGPTGLGAKFFYTRALAKERSIIKFIFRRWLRNINDFIACCDEKILNMNLIEILSQDYTNNYIKKKEHDYEN